MRSLAALRALGTGSEPPAESRQRVFGALFAVLEAAAAGAAAGVEAAPIKPATSVSPTPAGALLTTRLAASKLWVVAAGLWLFGAATGAALYGALRPAPVRIVYLDRPRLASSASELAKAPEASVTTPPLAAPSQAPSLGSSRPAAPASRTTPLSELARERALLELARQHAAHGEPALVLSQVALHLRLFPHGRLAEEREALAIRALLSLGNRDEAHSRAQAFHRAYPESFLAPMLDAALSAP